MRCSLGVGDRRCWLMLCFVYPVLGINSWSPYGEIERNDLTWHSLEMVELCTWKRDMGGEWGSCQEKLKCMRISCASQCINPDMACSTSNPAGQHTNTRYSKPTQAGHSPVFSHPLILLHIIPIFILISLIYAHNSTIIREHKVKLYCSNSVWHGHESILSTAYTEYSIQRVQHTLWTAYTKLCRHWQQHQPSTVCTEYSINRGQHTPRTAYTEYSLHWVQLILSIASNQNRVFRASCQSPFILTMTRWLLTVPRACCQATYRLTAPSQLFWGPKAMSTHIISMQLHNKW